MTGRQEAEAIANSRHAGVRVDRFIAEEMQLFSRSQLRQHEPSITINGTDAKPSRVLHEGDLVRVVYSPKIEPSITAEAIDLDILYEDANVVVVNKPQGMVVHPAAGNWTGTLAQGLAQGEKALLTITLPGVPEGYDRVDLQPLTRVRGSS